MITLEPIKNRISPDNWEEANKNWEIIVNACSSNRIDDDGNLAAICATVAVETGCRFLPVKEEGSNAYFITNYWKNIRIRKQLGNRSIQDAVSYCGRGYIQLTGFSNYLAAAKELNARIVSVPELACDPVWAAKILVWYWIRNKLNRLGSEAKEATLPEHKVLIYQTIRRRVNGGLNGLVLYMDVLKDLGAL